MGSDDPNREAHGRRRARSSSMADGRFDAYAGFEHGDMGSRSSMDSLSEAKRGRFSWYPGVLLMGNFGAEAPLWNGSSATYSGDRRHGLAISRRAQTQSEDVR